MSPYSRSGPRVAALSGPFRWLFLIALTAFACQPAADFLEKASDVDSESAPVESSQEMSALADPEAIAARVAEDVGMTLAEALDTPAEDHRPRLLELMGPPDTFRLTFQQLEGTEVRWEEWAYYDLGARFDFVDGQLLWNVDLEPPPEVAIYAHFYDPRDFTAAMSPVDARTLLADQEVAEMDLAEGDIPGGLMLAADQLLLGFDGGRLVYAESFFLTPEVQP